MKHWILAGSVFFFMIAMGLSSCATPYQPRGWSGGYSDYPLQDDMFTVTFQANGYTSRERVRMFLLYRCAELTLERGYLFFAVIESNTDHTIFAITNTYSRYQSQTTIGHKPSATHRIKVFRENPDASNPNIYDATQLKQNLESQVVR